MTKSKRKKSPQKSPKKKELPPSPAPAPPVEEKNEEKEKEKIIVNDKDKDNNVEKDETPPQTVSSSDSSSSDDDNDNDNEKDDNNQQEDDASMASESNNNNINETITTTTPSDGVATPDATNTNTNTITTKSSTTRGYSRLFSPYRTLGIVSHGPFHLLPNQNSSNAMICAAIGERFHIMQCDKLHPVLVSQAVPAGGGGKRDSDDDDNSNNKITHLLSDSSLSITLVSHGTTHVTLFQRTRPLQTVGVCNQSNNNKSNKKGKNNRDWAIVDMLHLGRIRVEQMKGEKEGKMENTALIAVILSKGKPIPTDDGVPIVGDDDDDESMDSNSSSSDEDSSGDDEDNNQEECRGQVVLLLASRTSLTVHKRILLSKLPDFCPRVAIHPPTYVNKIVIGGSSSKTYQDQMILLNVKTEKIIHVFKCLSPSTSTNDENVEYSNDRSEITCLESSPAIDTIAVGTSTGMVHLVNTRYDQLLFSLHHKTRSSKGTNNGNKGTRITSMSFRTDGSALQYGIAPLAVGRADGNITIWDLTPPKDNDDSDSDDDDNVIMGRTLLCEMERVHYPGGVHKLQYMPQEPLLLSTGTNSNSVVMHIFDNPDHSGRILRQRKGHTAPPKYIRYLHPGGGAGGGVLVNAGDGTDAAACQILSGGSTDRTLRLFSTVRSVLDKEYSQGRGLEKRARQLGMKDKSGLLLPPIKSLVTCEARSRDWGDVVTIHDNHAFAYVWSSKRGAQSGPTLRQDHWNISAMKTQPPISAHATSVTISTCGNFALVGTKGGTIYKYNVQSGNPRGCYPINPDEDNESENRRGKVAGDIRKTFKELEKKMKISNRASNIDKEDRDRVERARREQLISEKLKVASHSGAAVTGIAVDGINKTVISVGADSKLILWNFKTHAPHKKSPYRLPAAATKLCHVQDSDLAAVALEDYSSILFDCSTLTVVRRFGYGQKGLQHDGPISDLGFSPDGRTLYTASLDSTIRVWDVPTNACVDWLGFKSPPTSISVSPTGEFLATTHIGKLGISLWSDRSFYQTVHVDGAQHLTAPASMDDPAPLAEVESGEDEHENAINRILASSADKAMEEEKEQQEDESTKGPILPKEEGLVTLSGLPPAHWKNLFHLELVKQRNKPTEAPKKPPSAPFFLQWRPGETVEGEPSKNPTTENEGNQSDAEWDAVWSDDDDNNNNNKDEMVGNPAIDTNSKRERESESDVDDTKRRKVTHYRSHLAALLEECDSKRVKKGNRFSAVTEHIATLGPSAIDVSLSALCNGMHDLDEGLRLLILACRWLVELCQSRERFEAANAYLHRFLYLHSSVLAGIGEATEKTDEQPSEDASRQKKKIAAQREELVKLVAELRTAQNESAETLQSKMQNTLCLLRHFSRMV